MKQSISIPLGSQHIALLEPVRFRFETHNETIVGVEADVGYVHRGVERACTSRFEFKQIPAVVARVCGLCAITHSLSYTLAVEQLVSTEVSRRAQYLRTLMVELDRLHSHLLCLAHTAENAGYEALFMQIMGDRELIMELQERITGNRVQFDFVCIGGVHRDVDAACAKAILDGLATFEPKLEALEELFETNWTLSLKYKGIGAISKEDAAIFNALGPLARAAGLRTDVRAEQSVLPYQEVGFEMVVEEGGDIYARNRVRLREMRQSMAMVRNILEGLPEGELQAKVKGKPEGESIMRLEAPRGELFYYLRGNKTATLERMRIKTPTFSGIPAMVKIFKGQEYGDVPAILASFDPCMSCTAK
ncbi:nickel-dependent hydrogenase large subunit [Sulfurospirillum sp. T05]|uniref:Nickel-dependent hydrogenase large subunit n=1 Tax=Sulfurospirillum tamanense TaxID=2813362 RepID=A0ABS2WV51_9BACT|nr:nickel-dependent hydrogenase large subunit [Sulfurospirillum tamanensis]MBN2965534.1 nickel-dependent hydrogenase large subunit [Sulfurospirillum tamanensis]